MERAVEEANKEVAEEVAEEELAAFESLSRLKKETIEYPNNSNSEENPRIDGKPPEEKPDLNRFGREYNKDNKNNKDTLLFGGGILIAAITSVVLLLK